MARLLSIGCSGTDVRDLQRSLNKRPPSTLAALTPDGAFGPKTAARVKEFQKNNQLNADGIVGPMTWDAVIMAGLSTIGTGCPCGNGDKATLGLGQAIAHLYASNPAAVSYTMASKKSFGNATPMANPDPPTLFGTFRFLTKSQQGLTTATYGSSIDFSRVLVSNQSGAQNRPFTVAMKPSTDLPWIQVMNCGTFEPLYETLIHELAHVWQSQHHSDPTRFMVNAVDSQAGAVVANLAAPIDDPAVILNKNHPQFFPFDAYCYTPGMAFGGLAAEQMAKAIENNEKDIVDHVKGVAQGVVDPALVAALSRVGFGDRRMAYSK